MATETTGFLQQEPVAQQPQDQQEEPMACDEQQQQTIKNECQVPTSPVTNASLVEVAPTVTVITHASTVPSSNYITLQESDLTSETSSESSRPPYIHYVDSSHVYASTNGELRSYSYAPEAGGLYSAAAAAGYNPVLAAAGYVQDNTVLTDEDGRIISPNSSRDTVQWLLENYETAEGVSLPRSTLYNHYLRYCADMKIEPINAASFGKLIRSVFVNIRTRRLGTRGNSKYHYYGIRVKLGSYLADLRDDIKPLSGKNHSVGSSSESSYYEASYFPSGTNIINSKHLQFLGDSSDAIPIFPNLDSSTVVTPESGITEEDLSNFKMLYKEHCEAFLDSLVGLNFVMVETIWQTFWRTYSSSHILGELEKILTKDKLYHMSTYQPVLRFMQDTDLQFYQNLVDILIPDVLRPIPTSMTQSIRHFAKHLEGWLTSAMRTAPKEALQAKLAAAGALSQTLRRYTSLNHLAQAGRAVLQNPGQLTQMALDLAKVDFNHIKEQASWVCQCDENLLQHLAAQFKESLRDKKTFEQWADWLERVVDLIIPPYNTGDVLQAARTFLLRWSFYCSLVIRDLTLRSAASFGSFHLLRLLFDEYMFYLVEHKVAAITGKMPISVMAPTLLN